jgi:pimeloyl-ACP methyl ester carboxylesterase
MAEVQDQSFQTLGFHKSRSSDGVVGYHKNLSDIDVNTPILVLLHGYPNSAYLWRHVVPLLSPHPLFVPDLPGYGNSAPPTAHDKVSVGMLIPSALHKLLASPNPPTNFIRPVVLIGHDRGARVAHHLHVSSPHAPIQGFSIKGLALLDIAPTQSQWEIGGSAPAATGFFHWSFLANPQIAIPMIQAYGGAKWARDMIERWAGKNVEGQARIKSGGALEVYGSFFQRAEVIEATTMDYEAGATTDLVFEKQAIEEGRRISVPLLLVYSAGFLPKRATKPILEVWSQPWSEGAHSITECPIGDDIGHFVPEEAPEATADAIQGWLQTLTL